MQRGQSNVQVALKEGAGRRRECAAAGAGSTESGWPKLSQEPSGPPSADRGGRQRPGPREVGTCLNACFCERPGRERRGGRSRWPPGAVLGRGLSLRTRRILGGWASSIPGLTRSVLPASLVVTTSDVPRDRPVSSGGEITRPGAQCVPATCSRGSVLVFCSGSQFDACDVHPGVGRHSGWFLFPGLGSGQAP